MPQLQQSICPHPLGDFRPSYPPDAHRGTVKNRGANWVPVGAKRETGGCHMKSQGCQSTKLGASWCQYDGRRVPQEVMGAILLTYSHATL